MLGVPDVRRAAEHYRDVLGFRLGPDGVFAPDPAEPGGVYAIVERDGVSVHLQIRRGELTTRLSERPAFERDVYVYVGDVEAVHAELQRRGARIVQPPRLMPYGIRECVVEDLVGHRLAFGRIQN